MLVAGKKQQDPFKIWNSAVLVYFRPFKSVILLLVVVRWKLMLLITLKPVPSDWEVPQRSHEFIMGLLASAMTQEKQKRYLKSC